MEEASERVVIVILFINFFVLVKGTESRIDGGKCEGGIWGRVIAEPFLSAYGSLGKPRICFSFDTLLQLLRAMKTIILRSLLFCSITLFVVPRLSQAQSVSINSVSASSFCSGDSISVSFTATGAWGHKNAFTLQLSDTSGSFANGVFTNVGSLADSVSGTFTISSQVPANVTFSNHYRLRVIGANPYRASADNGSNISVGSGHHRSFQQFKAWTVNAPLHFNLFSNNGSFPKDTIYWSLGDGADQTSFTEVGADQNHEFGHTTTYSSAGLKTVVARSVSPGGCTASDTLLTYVFDCSVPPIPHDAYVIDKDIDLTSLDLSHANEKMRIYANIWVNPGVTFIGGELDTIYAEAGSTIGNGPGNIVFLKPGAIYNGRTASVVIADQAASVDPIFAGGPVLKCSNLDFDYSNAPPNIAFPKSDVSAKAVAEAITLSPNPASGIIKVNDVPLNLMNVSVLNLLGASVMEITKPNAAGFQIDLTNVTPGVYYLRFVMPGAIVTKKIVRE
jgi:hypothetical protein